MATTLVPIDFDPFADQGTGTRLTPVDYDPFAKPENSLERTRKVVSSSYLKGVASLLGLPADFAGSWVPGAYDWVDAKARGLTPEQKAAAVAERNARSVVSPETISKAGSAVIGKAIESAAGTKFTEPQTGWEHAIGSVAEFAPGALALGPGGVVRRLAVGALAPGLGGEAAAALVPNEEAKPYARMGGAILGGGAASLFAAPRSANEAVRQSVRGMDQATINQAETLIQDAARMGVALGWDEAINQVSRGVHSMTDLRRVVENSRGGSEVYRPLMAERPAQIGRAADVGIDDIASQRMEPYRAGLANQTAAERELASAQAGVNAATRADYAAAETQRLGVPVQNALRSNPIYVQTLDEIRGNPLLNQTIAHLPDDSVAVVDLVQRRMRETAANARVPGQANSSNLVAANLEDARTPAIEAAEMASGGRYGDYARARARQEQLREEFLEPRERGPLGQISRTGDIMEQGKALLPTAPARHSEQMIGETVSRLARQNPEAASNLIYQQVRSTFDEATQNLAPGPNQWGGSKFAAAIAGNNQQARNLEAAIRALPAHRGAPPGDVRWEGFRRFLDVMEATGKRPQAGSLTAFNTETIRDLKQGSLVNEAASGTLTGGFSVIKRLNDFREQMNLGNNTRQIANLLTNPDSGRVLARLARERPGSARAAILALRLSYMGRQGYRPPASEKAE
jgi:hypothetical protein